MLKKIVTIFVLITWPITLYLANTQTNFIHYLIPALLVAFTFFLHKKNYKLYFLPLFVIPFIEPKFAILPLVFLILNFDKKNIVLLLASVAILILFLKPFIGQSILRFDYQGGQQVLQEQKLYHSVFLARLFQNKARIPTEKLAGNLFSLTDPNNYFFGFAPRQITIDNQNLKKFPFLTLPFLLIGLFFIKESKNYKLIITLGIAVLLNLSLLTNFDRNDFILWIPLFLIILNGLNHLWTTHKHIARLYCFIFIFFASVEILRIFILK